MIDVHVIHGPTDRYRHLSEAELNSALTRARQRAWNAESDVEDLLDEQRFRADRRREARRLTETVRFS